MVKPRAQLIREGRIVFLGHLPTPLEPMTRLSALLKSRWPNAEVPALWVKRDDMTGLFLGGNKTRKLEYLVAEALQEEIYGDLAARQARALTNIQESGRHLLSLINDVLDMAKIESGKMNLAPEKLRVHEILEEVTSITSTLASEKNLSLFIESNSDQELEIFADRTRLRQIMINIVNNAIKFTEKGRISMRASLQNEHALITVRDTGIGIPTDKLEAVFQEFTQVDSSTTRKAGGTGLGLPISRRLVEMHGGHIWAESTGVSGEGATFFVELPLEAKLAEPIEKTEK